MYTKQSHVNRSLQSLVSTPLVKCRHFLAKMFTKLVQKLELGKTAKILCITHNTRAARENNQTRYLLDKVSNPKKFVKSAFLIKKTGVCLHLVDKTKPQ